ncbi:MAG: hypothetical protein HLUCCA01_07515 [Bacteroidetes bacterium HLUCCA01]|nr:MAG: hypothetical protein HLUCCA01_07515 [Bacteroidetes bacterium HLUCCA01]
MGRALLFLVAGSFVIFGMLQLGVSGRQSSMNEINVGYVLDAQARNIANSALESALNRLMTDDTWRAGPQQPFRYQYGDEYADVQVVDASMQGVTLPPNVIEIRSKGVSGDRQASAVARIEVEDSLPTIESTMGIFTNNLTVNISGSSFLIDGNDNAAVPGGALPGIAVNSQAAYDEFMKLNSSQLDKIQGPGGGTSIVLNTEMDADALETFIAQAVANADAVYDDHTASGANSLGSVEDPQIIVVNGTLDIRNATGAGIIIVREGGILDARGNLDNYQGLIIIQGTAGMSRGNIHIRGAMLFGGANPAIEIDIDFRGNVNILYDSSVLNQLSASMPETAGKKQRVVGIYD